MSAKELITQIATEADITPQQAEIAFKTMFESITNRMKAGDEIAVPNFGKFGTKVRAARKGRNPSTGAVIDIEQATVAFFKPATQLKNTINR
jgi:DNA-binding protein HU-beta